MLRWGDPFQLEEGAMGLPEETKELVVVNGSDWDVSDRVVPHVLLELVLLIDYREDDLPDFLEGYLDAWLRCYLLYLKLKSFLHLLIKDPLLATW